MDCKLRTQNCGGCPMLSTEYAEQLKKKESYEEMYLRSLQCAIMLERGMVPDVSTYRSVFCTEGGDAPWMLDQAG